MNKKQTRTALRHSVAGPAVAALSLILLSGCFPCLPQYRPEVAGDVIDASGAAIRATVVR
jgi:hypothetical protein